MKCIRCGQHSTQYGSDGLPYCDSCLFYGLNVQCQKCGMYLPRLELQMYAGQWYCPYCIMDLREQHQPKIEKEKPLQDQSVTKERCDRCGRSVETVIYYFQGKKLCEVCLNQEKGDNFGPVSPPAMRIKLNPKKEPFYAPLIPVAKPAKLFADGFFAWVLKLFGIKRKSNLPEIIPVKRKNPKKEKKNWSEYKKDQKSLAKK